jgi:hypothetical protein
MLDSDIPSPVYTKSLNRISLKILLRELVVAYCVSKLNANAKIRLIFDFAGVSMVWNKTHLADVALICVVVYFELD